MNDFDQSFLEFQAAQQTRRAAEHWLATFEAALATKDAEQIAALFHQDSHWRDVLAFTWHMTPVARRGCRRLGGRWKPCAPVRVCSAARRAAMASRPATGVMCQVKARTSRQ